MIENQTLNFLIENWEFIFLYVFKYLKDIDFKLDTLHIDNKEKEVKINHIEKDIDELKGWIQRVESECSKKNY